MKRIALTLVAVLIMLGLIYQLIIINSPDAALSEAKIISLAFLSEFILFFATVILLRNIYLQKNKISQLKVERHELQKKASSDNFLNNNLFNHTNTAVMLVALDGKIQQANQAFYRILGYSVSKKTPNLNYFLLIDPKDFSDLQVHLQDLIDGTLSVYQCEQQCLKKNGEMMWSNTTLSMLRDEDNRPVHFIVQLENITLQKRAEERLQHMAYHDPLTGLANRNKLEQFINHVIATSRRQQTGFAVMFIDLDRFKNVNDSVGHDAGDMLLQIVSERLESAVRNSDMVSRLGGDEFIILITDVKKPQTVAAIAKKILENVLRVISINDQEIYITTSIGISIYPNDGQNMQTLLKHADLALYRAKEHGRNNYEFYANEMTNQAQEKLLLQNALGHALAKNEFLLNYQPKMDLKTRKITGIEALLRWKNKDFGSITPDEIIALAEETGLIIPVSDWVLENACTQLKKWHDQGMTSLTMAVNCSARQFKNVTFVDDVLAILNKTGVSPRSLEMEITESIIMDDPENTLRVLFALKDIGVKIVIDDFGTGYWSLNNLKQLSIDKIKIDKSFIRHVTTDETSATITTAILAMAKKMGCETIAEGVETHQQYAYLERENCNEIQGYYLTRPLNEDMMTNFLKHPIPDAESISKTEIIS